MNYLRIVHGAVNQVHTIELEKKLDESKESLLSFAIFEIRQLVNSRSKEILVPFYPDVLMEGMNYAIPQRGEKKQLLELSERNVKFFKMDRERQRGLRRQDSKLDLLNTIKNDLKLPRLPHRMECFDNYLNVYKDFMPKALERAKSEGRSGARWPKCTGNFNREWPGSAHAYLIWHEPHPIYFAEMQYRQKPAPETLEKWKDVVLNTADYMADYLFYDKKTKQYVLGPPVVVVSENTDPLQTINPIFELGYFRYGLRTALEWADRLGLSEKRTKKWKEVLSKMASLPVADGVYTTYEGIPDMWTKYTYEHPALTGVYGMLPGDGVDQPTFKRTLEKVSKEWQFNRIWGWDFPMLAMAAARTGQPALAIDMLMHPSAGFQFDEHGLATGGPFPYFPSNGALLTAVAMMCGGWDGSEGEAPGFPKDGSWTVRYEGFVPMQ